MEDTGQGAVVQLEQPSEQVHFFSVLGLLKANPVSPYYNQCGFLKGHR